MNDLRRWMDMMQEGIHGWTPPSEDDEPYVNAHQSGHHTVEIEMLLVPKGQRGEGIGRRVYEEWEARLPPHIHFVKLLAADTGSGNAYGFWEKMGFEFAYVNPDDWPVKPELMMWMVKGVNGHPTPEPIVIGPPDD